METKICNKCGIEKLKTDFNKDCTRKDGLRLDCRECSTAYAKHCGKSNKNKRKLQNKLYKDSHKKEVKEYNEEWRKSNNGWILQWKDINKEHIEDYNKKYLKTNKQHLKQVWKEYREDNREIRNTYNREYQKNNPDKYKAYNNNRRARKMKNGGTFTAQEWIEVKVRYNNTCLRCFDYEPNIKLTIDHVVSLVSGGSNSIENIQPLCKSCNSAKGTKSTDYRCPF